MIPVSEILEKLDYLRKNDKSRIIFGSSRHGYGLRPVAREEEVSLLEERLGFRLPEDYREFILKVGNGGAGPGYGLVPLGLQPDENQLQTYRTPFQPELFQFWGQPVPDGEEPMQGVDYDIELFTGCKFLYDGGCCISTYLVLNHEEQAGKTAVFGYCPVSWGGTFIGDYMDWLNAAVEKVSAGLTETPENRPATPWWKFW